MHDRSTPSASFEAQDLVFVSLPSTAPSTPMLEAMPPATA